MWLFDWTQGHYFAVIGDIIYYKAKQLAQGYTGLLALFQSYLGGQLTQKRLLNRTNILLFIYIVNDHLTKIFVTH